MCKPKAADGTDFGSGPHFYSLLWKACANAVLACARRSCPACCHAAAAAAEVCGTHDGLRWIRLLLRYANIIQLSPLLNPVLGIYNILASSCSSQQQEAIINPLDGASDRLLTWPCTSCQDWPSKLHLQQEVHFSDVGA